MAHQFCGLHKIGYDTTLDYHCPQCIIGRIFPVKQYAFDTVLQKPVDAAGAPLAPAAVTP
jgi:hypothetical protein